MNHIRQVRPVHGGGGHASWGMAMVMQLGGTAAAGGMVVTGDIIIGDTGLV
jgi:hypothetical protein